MNNEIKSFYNQVLVMVNEVTGVTDVFGSNKEESVDARAVLIYALSSKGVSDLEIASLTGLTRQCVNKLKNSHKYRKTKWSYISSVKQISNALATNSF